ncbi:MAG: LUD domain-containing protein [Thermoplasmata archaeon]
MFREVHKRILDALVDDDLRRGSKESTKNEMINRKNAIKKYSEIEEWRNDLRNAKKMVLENLDTYIEKFKKSSEDRGFIFHFAEDIEDSRNIVISILEGSKTVVKSKSMVGEEISLRQFLSEKGISVYETDLGEFLVQISGGRPAHMVTPAVNISAKRASNLLEMYIGKRTDDIREMVLGVRIFMRDKFFSSDAGIIGANSISADGNIVFITNEGNGALTHILPEKIILVTSVEKILPSLKDCLEEAILQTVYDGYRNISYIHIINSPGPKEFHIILVDNGRRKAYPSFLGETLYCIKCGSCQLACPIFKEIDGAWGDIYTAAIGIPWTYITGDRERARSLSYICLSCGLCNQVCPMGIDIKGLIRKIKRMR